MKHSMKVSLPDDLKQVRRKKIRLYMIALVILLALEILLSLIFLKGFIKRGAISIFINVLVLLLIPYLLIWRPLKKDSSWVGEIIESSRAEEWYYHPWIRSRSYRGTSEIRLLLKNGEEVFEKTVYAYEGNHDIPADRFKKGYTAVHVLGAKETAVLPQTENDINMCIVCGEVKGSDETHCHDCGHTLLSAENIRNI